ncbi:MAG: hypothetical protein V4597_08510 [Pseudomonadota bacterium]
MRPSSAFMALALVAALALSPGCAPVPVKQQVDRADRTAFESLRTFQQIETGLFQAGLAWPTAAQHKAIASKLSSAYLLVVDVANAALSLKAGEPAPAQLQASLAQLGALVADVAALASQPAGAPPNATAAAEKAKSDAAKLSAAVQGVK